VLIVSSERPEIVDHAWTTEQVLRITGVSKRRLGYWLDRGILSADVDEARGRGRVRLWSFADLVEVRVVLWLRDRVSLQLIGRIVEHLRKRGIDQPLAELRFAVIDTGRAKRATDVVVQQPDGNWETPIEGQVVMEVVLPLVRFADELRVAAERPSASATARTVRASTGTVGVGRGAGRHTGPGGRGAAASRGGLVSRANH
jgi:DNA-binding transcriptional MerR regulator